MNIKKLVIILSLLINKLELLALPNACSQKKSYYISGQLKDLTDGSNLYLMSDRLDTVSKAVSRNGKFILKFNQPLEGTFYSIYINTLGPSEPFLKLFLDKSNITISGTFRSWPEVLVRGSGSNDDFLKVRKAELGLLKSKLNPEQANDSVFKLIKLFVQKNPNSVYSPFLIYGNNAYSLVEKQNEIDKLSDKAKASFYGIELKKQIERLKKSKKIAVGNIVQDFTSRTPEGKYLSLSEIVSKSKLTLVDFWASWCIPCREETPNIKKVYELFHEKGFNVFSVSFDFKETSWKNAIAKDGMKWYNVSDLIGRESEAHKLYKLNGIPAFLLIDSMGKIIALDAAGSGIPDQTSLRGNYLFKEVEGYFNGGFNDQFVNDTSEASYIERNRRFLRKNKNRPGIYETPSGLQYKILKEGYGEKPSINDKVVVHYTGLMINEQKIESSYDKVKPFQTTVKDVIKGWSEALQLMPAGSKWRIYISADLGYGYKNIHGIPAGSTLIFDIELLEIIDKN